MLPLKINVKHSLCLCLGVYIILFEVLLWKLSLFHKVTTYMVNHWDKVCKTQVRWNKNIFQNVVVCTANHNNRKKTTCNTVKLFWKQASYSLIFPSIMYVPLRTSCWFLDQPLLYKISWPFCTFRESSELVKCYQQAKNILLPFIVKQYGCISSALYLFSPGVRVQRPFIWGDC